MKHYILPFSVAMLLTLLPLFAGVAFAQGSAANACPSLTRDLSVGSQGSDVIALQRFLISSGLLANGNDSGYFGPVTLQSVIRFQAAQNINPAAGMVGPLTQAAIQRVCTLAMNTAPLSSLTPTPASSPSPASTQNPTLLSRMLAATGVATATDNTGPIYADGSTGGNPVGFHGGNDTNSLLVQSHTPINSGTNYTENFIMLDAINGTPSLIPTGQSVDNIPVCLNVTRNNGQFGLFSVDCAGNLQSSGGASFSGTIYGDQQLPICPGPRCFFHTAGNPNNGLHLGGSACPFNGDKPCPALVQSLAPSNSTPMMVLDAFLQTTGGSNPCLDVTRNNGATSLFRVDCNGKGVASSSISGLSHNPCSATSGWPCVTATSCSISSATGCWGTATVPAGSLCTVTADSSDTTVGIQTFKTTVIGTVLTVTATTASLQAQGAVSHSVATCM